MDNIDVYVGGLLEGSGFRHVSVGPLFAEILKEHFTRIRDSDRYWYENLVNGLVSCFEVYRGKLTYIELLLNVLNNRIILKFI